MAEEGHVLPSCSSNLQQLYVSRLLVIGVLSEHWDAYRGLLLPIAFLVGEVEVFVLKDFC